MYYVYILKSISLGQLYLGYTNDLKIRFKQHITGKSKYTKRANDWEVVYYESYKSEKDARNREKSLKKYAKAFGMLKHRIEDSLK